MIKTRIGKRFLSNNLDYIIAGFPRSGNTFLSYAIKKLYFPTQSAKYAIHTTNALKKQTNILVPVRNPIDSIVSYHIFTTGYNLIDHVYFYKRFYTEILNNKQNLLILEFTKFTNDLDYLREKLTLIGFLNSNLTTTIEDVINEMKKDKKTKNLPQNNEAEASILKETLQRMPEIALIKELYNNVLK